MSPTGTTPHALSDSLDRLVPPPKPWWIRFVIGATIVGAVAVAGFAWHFGHIRPSPDCCGSGSVGPSIGLGAEPGTVTVTTAFQNFSGRPLLITAASADLPGATVVAIEPYSANGYEIPPETVGQLPTRAEGHDIRWLAVTFRPDECEDDRDDWGSITFDLEFAERPWWPTLRRSFENPEPIVAAGPNISILAPAAFDDDTALFADSPGVLAISCRLLGLDLAGG